MNIDVIDEEVCKAQKDTYKAQIKLFQKKGIIENIKMGMLLLFLVAEIAIIGVMLDKYGVLEPADKVSDQKIAVINMNKPITSEYIYKIIDKIDKVVEDEEFKEILFIMNSPGGSPTASEEMSSYLKEVTKIKKITMFVGGYALSGGYYIASAIKPLKANPNALVGSIGVIMQHYNIEKLAKNIGIEESTITKGKFKQPLSFFRKTDENQTAYINEHMLQPTYKNFIQAVATNRGLKFEKIEEFAEGMIFVANSEKIKGILVDEIDTLYNIRKSYKDKYGKKVSFVDISKERKPFNLFDVKANLKFDGFDAKLEY